MKRIALIDYGIGNITSIANAIIKIGCVPVLTDDRKKILSSDALILPGVGSFPAGMKNLNKKSLQQDIHDFIQSGNPFLGICLGMQMLFEFGYEFEKTEGLGLIKGAVRKINTADGCRLPHVGWSNLIYSEKDSSNRFLGGIKKENMVYFVHSFVGFPADENILASAKYCDINFCAAVCKDNIVGTQFHPEKSGEIGLKMLKNFVNN